MEHRKVDSSHISSIGHEGAMLEVRFKSGQLYRYYGVPSIIFTSLLRAKSVGKFFHENVKEHYPYTLIEEP